MARTASQIKMGYYPTPESEMVQIKSKIKYSGDDIHTVLDLCCGTGEFTRIFPETETYGVEIDYGRYREAAEKAKHVVWGDAISEFSATNNAFSCLYLNPPYDWSRSETTSERMEVVFLRKGLKYLKKNSLLIFVIPRYVLAYSARLLANHFKQIKVMAFTEAEYDAFKQVVVFGYKDMGTDPETEEYLKGVADAKELVIPRLDQDDSIFFLSPSSTVNMFQTIRLDPEIVLKKLMKNRLELSGLFKKESIETIKTIMPLRQGHKAMILASGMMNGVYGEGENRVLVKGTTIKTKHQTDTDKGFIEKEKLEIIIKSINLHTGEFVDIK